MEIYLDYKRKEDIHGTVLYPAPMIGPLQFDVLQSVAKNNGSKILDPFHGSSVSLYEAAKLNNTFEIYGFDINPFANLISKAKLYGVSESIDDDIQELEVILKDKNFIYQTHHFPNINKWFKENIIDYLSKIKFAISKIESRQNRIFLWSIFSNIVRRYSNTRSSTYKLHSKKDYQIENIKSNVIESFIKEIKKSLPFYQKGLSNKIILKKSDSLVEMTKIEDGFFDVIITSPPYGDNKTTVPYGQFSTLAIFWIDQVDLDLEGWELDNYSAIDNNSMGGKTIKNLYFNTFELSIINKYVSKITNDKKIIKVKNFLYDYFRFLNEIKRISNKHIILTLGNRTVDKININLTEISKIYLENFGFKCNSIIEREMKNKRIPRKTSKVGDSNVSSINKEYILLMEKCDISTII